MKSKHLVAEHNERRSMISSEIQFLIKEWNILEEGLKFQLTGKDAEGIPRNLHLANTLKRMSEVLLQLQVLCWVRNVSGPAENTNVK